MRKQYPEAYFPHRGAGKVNKRIEGPLQVNRALRSLSSYSLSYGHPTIPSFPSDDDSMANKAFSFKEALFIYVCNLEGISSGKRLQAIPPEQLIQVQKPFCPILPCHEEAGSPG